MDRTAAPWRTIAGLIGVVALVVVIALPVLAADPSAPPSAAASPVASAVASPVAPPISPLRAVGRGELRDAGRKRRAGDEDTGDDGATKDQHAAKAPKEHEPEVTVTVEGTVAIHDRCEDGDQTYTLTDGPRS